MKFVEAAYKQQQQTAALLYMTTWSSASCTVRTEPETDFSPAFHSYMMSPATVFGRRDELHDHLYTFFLMCLLLKQLVTEPQVQLTAKKPFNWLQIRAKKSLQRRTQHELRSGESTKIIKQTEYTLRTNNNKEKLIKDSSTKLKKPYRD